MKLLQLIQILKETNTGQIFDFKDKDGINKINVNDLENICIVSKLSITQANNVEDYFQLNELSDVGIKIKKVSGEKCNRCWKYFDKFVE